MSIDSTSDTDGNAATPTAVILETSAVTPSPTQPSRWFVPAAALVVDLVLILVAATLGILGRDRIPIFDDAAPVASVVTGIAVWQIPLWLAALAAWGLYRPRNLGSGSLEYQSMLTATGITFGLTAAILYLANSNLSRGFFLIEGVVGLALLLLGRIALRRAIHAARQRGHLLNDVILSGNPRQIDEIAGVVEREEWLGYRILGAVTPNSYSAATTPHEIPVIGRTDQLGSIVRATNVSAVICTEGSFESSREFRRLTWDLEDCPTQVFVLPTMTDIAAERVQVRPIAGLPLVHVEHPSAQAASRWGKRLFDIVGSGLLIILSAPVMLGVAIAVKINDGGPVLFRQVRVGRHGRLFRCFKFRSMVVDAEKQLAGLRGQNESTGGVLFKMEKDPRITRVGRFIRRFSLDEFPQFFNVFRGDMSLVGPRPALPMEVDRYEEDVRRRLDVRPGITGLWQVSGRSDLPWTETVRLDLYYVDNWSMTQDLTILVRTARAVVNSAGAY